MLEGRKGFSPLRHPLFPSDPFMMVLISNVFSASMLHITKQFVVIEIPMISAVTLAIAVLPVCTTVCVRRSSKVCVLVQQILVGILMEACWFKRTGHVGVNYALPRRLDYLRLCYEIVTQVSRCM